MLRKLPSGLYFVVLILFFTPWWSAGCGEQKIVSMTGVQAATGFTLDIPSFREGTKKQRVPPDPFALVGALLSLAALIVGIRSVHRRPQIVSSAMGFTTGVLLLIFKARIDAKVLQEGSGVIRSHFETGFWATIALLFLASISQFIITQQLEPSSDPEHEPVSHNTPTQNPPAKVEAERKSQAVLIPTEPPPASKEEKNLKYMPPAMRTEVEKNQKKQ